MTFDKVYLAAIRVCLVCGACGRPQSGSGETWEGKAARRWFARCANSSSRSMMACSCTCRHMCRDTVKDTTDTCGATSYDLSTRCRQYLFLMLPNTLRLHLTPKPPPPRCTSRAMYTRAMYTRAMYTRAMYTRARGNAVGAL